MDISRTLNSHISRTLLSSFFTCSVIKGENQSKYNIKIWIFPVSFKRGN